MKEVSGSGHKAYSLTKLNQSGLDLRVKHKTIKLLEHRVENLSNLGFGGNF